MQPNKQPNRNRRVFAWLDRVRNGNSPTLWRSLLCWIVIGLCSGLFASLYWTVLEQFTHVLREFQGVSLLIVMPLAGFAIGLVIHVLGNPGEIGLIVDNLHSRGGRIETRENPSMLLSSLISISAGGSLGPEAPMVQVTGSLGTWVADRLHLQGEALRLAQSATP